MIIFPAWVVVSAQGSEIDLKREPALLMISTISSRFARRSGESVELPDGDHVVFAQLVEHTIQLRSVAIGTRDLFTENAGASSLLECFELKS
jgi:hypothetical protein